MIEEPAIYKLRARYSRDRLQELRNRLSSLPQMAKLTNFTIFCAGSYGRHEASNHSDIDLFFMHQDDRESHPEPRTAELGLFGALIDTAQQMGFPKFSNDCEYLTALTCRKLLEHLGSPNDDHRNLFTLRMLMLLESKPLYGNDAYGDIIRAIIESYYRDYPDHQSTFEPWFLINDIGRFWKTLLLNYEHRRNQPPNDDDKSKKDKTKQKVRNFKLKFSRMTTCFATIALLGAQHTPINKDQLFGLIVDTTPHERLTQVADLRPDTANAVQSVIEDYAWFLEKTALSTDDLQAEFDDKTERTRLFDRAGKYGDRMFDLLVAIDKKGDESNHFLRYLVI